MNQHGEVQPIGGINEKIEGFFEVCKLDNLDGKHGVIVPAKNMINLMLKREIIDAVTDGKFHIYAIDSIEDGIETLTGMPPGELQPDGNYPEGTLNFIVSQKLQELAKALKEKKEKEEEEEEKKKKENNET